MANGPLLQRLPTNRQDRQSRRLVPSTSIEELRKRREGNDFFFRLSWRSRPVAYRAEANQAIQTLRNRGSDSRVRELAYRSIYEIYGIKNSAKFLIQKLGEQQGEMAAFELFATIGRESAECYAEALKRGHTLLESAGLRNDERLKVLDALLELYRPDVLSNASKLKHHRQKGATYTSAKLLAQKGDVLVWGGDDSFEELCGGARAYKEAARLFDVISSTNQAHEAKNKLAVVAEKMETVGDDKLEKAREAQDDKKFESAGEWFALAARFYKDAGRMKRSHMASQKMYEAGEAADELLLKQNQS
ncbi:hypothetical protein DRN67_00075 [Candidatus Micrarchaeota archaeon]|mgnify:CR=1 FL=1|nr:MAG: hypothetical protein DRN67_00075 [Candidatus Micrarchaeota archaeon]